MPDPRESGLQNDGSSHPCPHQAGTMLKGSPLLRAGSSTCRGMGDTSSLLAVADCNALPTTGETAGRLMTPR